MQITRQPISGRGTQICIVRGETVALKVTVNNNSGPLNLTGYSFKSRIAFPSPKDFTTGNGSIVILNAALGTLQFNIPSGQTSAFPTGNYPYDFWMVSNTGVETPLFRGSFSIISNITPVP